MGPEHYLPALTWPVTLTQLVATNGKVLVAARAAIGMAEIAVPTTPLAAQSYMTGRWHVEQHGRLIRRALAPLRRDCQNGQVLVAGGDSLGSAELYDFPIQLMASVLPTSRSVQVGTPATAFATIINTDSNMATDCRISPSPAFRRPLTHQTTNPATNQVTGAPNAPVDILRGAARELCLRVDSYCPNGSNRFAS